VPTFEYCGVFSANTSFVDAELVQCTSFELIAHDISVLSFFFISKGILETNLCTRYCVRGDRASDRTGIRNRNVSPRRSRICRRRPRAVVQHGLLLGGSRRAMVLCIFERDTGCKVKQGTVISRTGERHYTSITRRETLCIVEKGAWYVLR
jgi:hypothetical protein